MSTHQQTPAESPALPATSQHPVLRRKCACAGAAGLSGGCEECGRGSLLKRRPAGGTSGFMPAGNQVVSGTKGATPGTATRAGRGERLGHQLGRVQVYPAAAGPAPFDLDISQPGDELELEADRMAERVLSEPATGTPAEGAVAAGAEPGRAQLKEAAAPNTGGVAGGSPAVGPTVGGGHPLPEPVRDFFEPRFGHDFSRVRIHTGARAEESARAVDALAYTVGNHIVFGAERYAPGTAEGRRLLAHELAHVTQQETGAGGRAHRLLRRDDKAKTPPPKSKTPPTKTSANPKPCVPKFKSLNATITSTVGMREVEGTCVLILGTPGKANGVTFTAQVEVPAGCTGSLQFVQLVDMCRSLSLESGNSIRRKTGGDYIDHNDPVDQQVVNTAGAVEFKSNDSPFQPVHITAVSAKANDSFKLWLMWKPDQPANADRVPLAMAKWSWSADAAVKDKDEEDCGKRWEVKKSKTSGGTGKATKDMPSATKTITQSDPPTEKGTC